MNKLKRLSEGIYPGLFFTIVILVLLGLPGNYLPTVTSFWDVIAPDKIVHFILFFTLSFLSIWGYRNTLYKKDKRYTIRLFIIVLASNIAFGGLTELLQKHVFHYRSSDISDFFADAIGCIIGISTFFFVYKKKLKKIKKSDSNI